MEKNTFHPLRANTLFRTIGAYRYSDLCIMAKINYRSLSKKENNNANEDAKKDAPIFCNNLI